MEPNQSAYRKHHGVESVLLRVTNDIFIAKENKNSTMLCMLDLSAAFDTIDFSILFDILEYKVGLVQIVLAWIKSYLVHRQQEVVIRQGISDKKETVYGVPQGSIIGPLIFTVYLIPMYEVLKHENCMYHSYADDTQFYITCKPINIEHETHEIERIAKHVIDWLNVHKLKVNCDKTEIMIFHPDRPHDITLNIDGAIVTPSSTVKNLGVVLNDKLSFDEHITNVCRTAFFKLRQIARNRKFLDKNLCIMTVTTLVLSRLNFCCSLYVGISKTQLARLQRVQNACERQIFKLPKHAHISQFFKELEWLKMDKFVEYRLLCIVYNCLRNQTPKYLTCLLEKYEPQRNLRSSGQNLLKVPFVKSETGRRSFQYLAPTLWNTIPDTIKNQSSINSFKFHLKKYFLTL